MADSGSIGIRIVDVPAASRHDPLALSYIVNRVAPGTSVRRRVEISNSTQSTASVVVYSAAASLRQGGFAFGANRAKNELSSWTSLSRPVLRLAPGTTALETVTIRVPKGASSGERYGVIWAEVSTSGSGGVKLANRVGIRMYVSIGPGGAPPSNFEIGVPIARRSASGQPLVVARIHNSGQRTIDISGSLTLSNGPGGVRAGPFAVKLGAPLGPGSSKSVTVWLDKRLPRGPWRAQLRLQGRSIHRVAVATLTFPRLG
ncbi:MAG: peptidase [Actinomycetota bacterium]|nr:peptidase [Actinomycetota bacterium]